jgi:hypothetical protein
VGNAGQQEPNGRSDRRWSRGPLRAHHWESEKRSQEVTDENLSREHNGS